jgi:hypothetical protein
MIGAHEKWQVSLSRLVDLERKEKELVRANALIERLRAENQVLKDEKVKFFSVLQSLKRHILVSGNIHKKWAIFFAITKLRQAKLI